MAVTKEQALDLAALVLREISDSEPEHKLGLAGTALAVIESASAEASSRKNAAKAGVFMAPWLDDPCSIDSDRIQAAGYTWRQMMEGTKNGARRNILLWAIEKRSDLHDMETIYRAGVCLKEGYGIFANIFASG